MNQMKEKAFIVKSEQTAHYGSADTNTMHVMAVPAAIQEKMPIDFMCQHKQFMNQ